MKLLLAGILSMLILLLGCGMKYTTKSGNQVEFRITLEDALLIGKTANLMQYVSRIGDTGELNEVVTSTGARVIIE